MLTRLILIINFLFIILVTYSQEEQEILSKAVQSYQKELPKLERQAFKELKKLDKSDRNIKNSEFKKDHFIIIPMFELKDDYIHYKIDNSFAKYIDFDKMLANFDVYILKDTIYKGSLHLSDFDNSYFSIKDTNRYNKPSFIDHSNLAIQILEFKPDMVFYPESRAFICFIKGDKLYMGRWAKQLQTFDYILPANEFIEKNPSFIEELQQDPNTGINRHH